MPERETCEVLIVGAGAAGSLYAARLAAAGKDVVVLEAGPNWTLGDLVSSQIWARRLKWGGTAVAAGGSHPFAHNVNHGSGVGGAALHHYATWLRFVPETFELASAHGRGFDWPFGYEALRPWYDRVQDEAGISGDAGAEPWRPPGAPYPMPPLARSAQGEVLARGFERAGLALAPLPVAINSVPYRGRPACIHDGWCDAGCPIGALFNPLVMHVPQARAAGAEFRTGCTVTRILASPRGDARGVEYVDARGERRHIDATIVVLAASVVQNARLLLASASDRHPHGLANGSGMVGSHLMVECIAFSYGLYDQPTTPYLGVNAGQLLHQRGWSESRRPFGAYHGQAAPAMKPNDLFGIAATRADLFGVDLDRFLRDAGRHLAAMLAFGGGAGHTGNRIVLDGERDRHGVPRARFEHGFDEETLALWRYLLEEGERVHRAAGARAVWSGPLATGHLTGGTIMGRDPARSVTDGYGRCHEVPNLLIAGAGLLPQSGGCNPTFTLYAVAERAIAHLLEHWSDYAA